MKKIDYHIHSEFSEDGYSKLEEIVRTALHRDLSEIAITDHFEPTMTDPDYPIYKAKILSEQMLGVQEHFAKHIRVRFGVEFGQPHRFPEITGKYMEKYPYDYVIASAHKGNKDTDVGMLDYVNGDVNQYCLDYLEQMKLMVEHNMFDCLAHFDLIKRYAGRQGVAITLAKYEEQIREIFKTLIYNGKGIEVNTSGLKDKIKSTMPDVDILKIYYDMGGEIITIGSDAHEARYVGYGVDQAIEKLKSVGFRYISVFSKHNSLFTPIVYEQKYF